MERVPEDSPYFRKYEYKSKFHETLKIGGKATYWQEMPLEEINKWADRQDNTIVMGFVGENPELEVVTEVDGEKKTVTLPWWARDRARKAPQAYYKKSPWVFRCVDIKAKAFAGIPWAIYPEDPAGADVGEKIDALPPEDALVTLLTEVNPEDNYNDWIAKISKDLDIYGKAFTLKLRKKEEGAEVQGVEGEVLLLKRLNPSTMQVVGDDSGIKSFVQQLVTARTEYEKENIIYFRDYDPDDDLGSISPLEACKKSVDVEIAANSHLSDFFENNAMPALIMSTPETLQTPEIKRYGAEFRKNFKGAGKRGKTAFLGSNLKPHQVTSPIKDLALKEIREDSRRAICGAFGVAMEMVGAWSAANFATADINRKSLYTETLIPRSAYIQGVLNAELVSGFDETPRFFRYEPEKLDVMQESRKETAEVMALLVEKKILKPEVAAVEMGFTEDDVPEPIENSLLIGQTGQESNFEADSQSQSAENDNKSVVAMRKYRRKAVNRCKDGRNPACDFRTEYIPDGTVKAIKVQLDKLGLVDDVHAVFDSFEA